MEFKLSSGVSRSNGSDRTNNNLVQGGDSPIKMTGCSSYLLGVKIYQLVPLRVL